MAQSSIRWNGKAVKARMRKAMVDGVNKTMSDAVEHARRNHEWNDQTGNLTRSIQVTKFAYSDEKGVVGQWGSTDVEYALIQELGGVIEPKNTKYLAIPVTDLARKAGSPRNLTNLAYVQSIKGQPMLVDDESGEVHYILKRSVTIPARPYLRPAGDAKYPELGANIKKAWERWRPGTSSGSSGGGSGGSSAGGRDA